MCLLGQAPSIDNSTPTPHVQSGVAELAIYINKAAVNGGVFVSASDWKREKGKSRKLSILSADNTTFLMNARGWTDETVAKALQQPALELNAADQNDEAFIHFHWQTDAAITTMSGEKDIIHFGLPEFSY